MMTSRTQLWCRAAQRSRVSGRGRASSVEHQ